MGISPTGRNDGSLNLGVGSTTVRQSPRTDFGTQMRNGIAAGAGTVGSAVGVAAPFVPGGAVVSAAVSGAAGSLAGGNQMGGSGAVAMGPDGIPFGGPGLNTPQGGGAGSAQGGGSQQDLLDKTKGMQEMMASFNLQYLQLQEKMQAENRSFTTVSNVMKTKHDTAKSSISNVR